MKPFVQPQLLALSLFALFPLSASAEYLRCGNEAVNVGDTRSALLQRCGEPVMKDTFCKPVEYQSAPATKGVNVVVPSCRNVDEWTYNPGRGQFMTTLQIDGGKVTVIKYGDRVQ
jgi:hypothetical protein